MSTLLLKTASIITSTPQERKPLSSPNVERSRANRIFAFNRFLYSFAPLPRLTWDLLILSVKIIWTVLAASARSVLPSSTKPLLGESVLITGAGHGIGRQLAIQLAGLGCVVVCWDSDAEANRATVSSILKEGGEVYGYMVDASKRELVREAARLMKEAGIPDVTILINNAAVLMHRPLLEHEDADVLKIFEVNVLSQFWTVQTFLPPMLQNKKGHIVSMCNMCGFYGVANEVPFCSSKFALRGLMEGLYEELRLTARNANINFTTVYPFYVDTGLAKVSRSSFPYIFGVISAEYAASEVIRAVQRNYRECAIPGSLYYLNAINRVLPDKAMQSIIDFLRNFGGKCPD